MSDFAPPTGPPPPKVPAGYKAVWNNEYKEWFAIHYFPLFNHCKLTTTQVLRKHLHQKVDLGETYRTRLPKRR